VLRTLPRRCYLQAFSAGSILSASSSWGELLGRASSMTEIKGALPFSFSGTARKRWIETFATIVHREVSWIYFGEQIGLWFWFDTVQLRLYHPRYNSADVASNLEIHGECQGKHRAQWRFAPATSRCWVDFNGACDSNLHSLRRAIHGSGGGSKPSDGSGESPISVRPPWVQAQSRYGVLISLASAA